MRDTTPMRRSSFERTIAVWAGIAVIALSVVVLDIYSSFRPALRSHALEQWAPVAAGAFIGSVFVAIFALAQHRRFRS